jgi:Resolvase, N terminal domain/Recombinase
VTGVGIYIRISKEGYRSNEEVAAQLRRYEESCRAEATRKGLDVDESAVVTETDVSGGKAVNDRALGRLIERVESGALVGIISPDVDRFARNMEHGLGAWRRVVEESDGRLVFVDEGIDSADGDAHNQKERLVYRLVNGEGFLHRVSGKFATVVKESVEAGIHSGSIPPRGYVWPGTRIELPNGKTRFKKSGPLEATDELPNVTAAFEAFDAEAEGAVWSKVIDILGCKGQGAASAVLRNRVYLGEARSGQTVTPGAHPRAVSDELFDRVQRKLKRRAEKRAERPTACTPSKHDNPLSGVLRCAACAGAMTPDFTDRQFRCKYQGNDKKEKHPHGKPSIGMDATIPAVLAAARGWHARYSPVFMLGREVDEAMRPVLEEALAQAEATVRSQEEVIGTALPADAPARAAVAAALAALDEHEAANGWLGMTPEGVEKRLAAGGDVNDFLRSTVRAFVAPVGRRGNKAVPVEERLTYQYLGGGESVDPAVEYPAVELPAPPDVLPVETAPADVLPADGGLLPVAA